MRMEVIDRFAGYLGQFRCAVFRNQLPTDPRLTDAKTDQIVHDDEVGCVANLDETRCEAIVADWVERRSANCIYARSAGSDCS